MSTSLLYHGFGLRGYQHVRTEFVAGEIVFTVQQPRPALRCPACHSAQVVTHGMDMGKALIEKMKMQPAAFQPRWSAD